MLHLTPELLRVSYALLRGTMPFKRWQLPESADVQFIVMRTNRIFADYARDGEQDVIRVSQPRHTRLGTLLASMAHEMVHLKLEAAGCRDRSAHGPEFKRLADRVCKHHLEFDRATF